MEEKLLDINYRKKVINEIKGDENVQRKIVAYKKHNMQCDNFYQYVKEYLESKLDAETVKELHIFANINLQKRISKAESSIYKKEPERMFFVNDNELPGMEDVYKMSDINSCFAKANESYKYQDQCIMQLYPIMGKIKSRVLLPCHYDVIPDEKNPEHAMAYIISNFDNTERDRIRKDNYTDRTGFSQGDKYRDSVNQTIADYDDQELEKERYTFWSNSFNFVCDGKGQILDKITDMPISEVVENDQNIMSPLAEFQIMPFVDISKPKDFEYWVRSGDTLYDATVMYNVILTSEFQTVEMQGHAQPFYKGDAEHMPENVRIGVDKMIFIPVNPNNEVNAEFGFANPGSDLAGIREFRESFLNSFLSSRGLDTSIISGSPQAQINSSGVERLLSMIEKFEASQEDFSLFRNAENVTCKIMSCWIASLAGARDESGNLILGEAYQLNITDPLSIQCNVEFSKPEMIKTEKEMIEIAQMEIEAGLSSRVHAVMDIKGMTEEQAIEYINKVDEYQGLIVNETTEVQ